MFNIILWTITSHVTVRFGVNVRRQDVPLGHYEENQMKQTVVPNRNAILLPFCMDLPSQKQRERNRMSFLHSVFTVAIMITPIVDRILPALQSAFELGNWESEMVDLTSLFARRQDIHSPRCTGDHPQLGFDFDTVLRNTITSYNPDDRVEVQEKVDLMWNEFWHSMQLVELTQLSISNHGMLYWNTHSS